MPISRVASGVDGIADPRWSVLLIGPPASLPVSTLEPAVIRAWAEARDGVLPPPPVDRGGRPRTLRFDFPGGSSSLERIDWDECLDAFRDRDLVFLYQDPRRDGSQSNVFRLDHPDREDG